MKRGRQWMFSCLAAWLLSSSPLLALPPQHNLGSNSLGVVSPGARYTPQRPVISPYLALAPVSGTQAQAFINYFALVRPQYTQQAAIQQQGTAIQQIEQDIRSRGAQPRASERSEIRTTGHRASYMTHERYFRSAGGSLARQPR
jgi:hypothetical protein